MVRIYLFLGGMWALIILGGGLAVTVLGPLDFGAPLANTLLKAVAAIALVVLWVMILVRLMKATFRGRRK